LCSHSARADDGKVLQDASLVVPLGGGWIFRLGVVAARVVDDEEGVDLVWLGVVCVHAIKL
jgi:hypothetical protein